MGDKGYPRLTAARIARYSNCLNESGLVVRFPAEQGIFLYRIQTGSGTRLASYPMHFSPDVKRPGREAEHWPPSSTITVKIVGTYASLPYAYMAFTGISLLYCIVLLGQELSRCTFRIRTKCLTIKWIVATTWIKHLVGYCTGISNTGTAVAQWLRCCATNRKVSASIPDGVIGIFHWNNPSDRTMALGSTQRLTEMSTRKISWG